MCKVSSHMQPLVSLEGLNLWRYHLCFFGGFGNNGCRTSQASLACMANSMMLF